MKKTFTAINGEERPGYQLTKVPAEIGELHQKAFAVALAEPMNDCYKKLVEARSAWNQVESSSLADFEFTDELVEEVMQAARSRLMGESSEETKPLYHAYLVTHERNQLG